MSINFTSRERTELALERLLATGQLSAGDLRSARTLQAALNRPTSVALVVPTHEVATMLTDLLLGEVTEWSRTLPNQLCV